MSSILNMPGFGDVKPITGGSNAMEPGVYLVRIKEVNPEFVAGTGTKGLQVTFEAIDGTLQSTGEAPAGRTIRDNYWYTQSGDSQSQIDFKNGRLKQLAMCAGIPITPTGFDTEHLPGAELTLKVKVGKASKKTGVYYAEVNYLRTVDDYQKEFAAAPAQSQGLPPAKDVSGAAAEDNGSRYGGGY